ncbi:HAD family hydrolase [Flavobacterium branchiicola]|uniref:HAD family hydrolase n=1 Tax=Flavobacterium branchiicola TaxID=1114875 RepID=A0ABV9PJ10_9FLAO|nr:HAD family hydrolase [Flavobacterium branchiicola]MBS7255065.1 haloacid dehalogenase-like hydrolase [Flavobacterium branchiicola]
MRKNIYSLFIVALLFLSCKKSDPATSSTTDNKQTEATTNGDPLPSWNDGTLKSDIIAYVEKVTKKGSPDFIPEEDRIATFDNDGTLWAEKPYVQELFAFYQVQKMVEAKPELAKKQPFKAVIEKDKAFFEKGGDKALIELVGATHTGMTEEAFETAVKDFFAGAKYPGKNVPVKQIRYQPQLELLTYLRANGFKTYIVTGGTIEVVRAISQDFYGIPKDQVVGTSFKYKYDAVNNAIQREPALDHFNDKEGKPVGIQLHIGKRPVFACGNEGGSGDIAMLQYTQGNKYPSFQLLVNHNDSIREYSYQEKDNASLNAAAKNKWHVIDMKNDWKKVFADQ